MVILIHTFQCLYNESFYKAASFLLSSLTWFIAQLHNIFQERYLTGVFWTDTYLGMSLYCFKSRTTTCWVLKSCFPHFPPLRVFFDPVGKEFGTSSIFIPLPKSFICLDHYRHLPLSLDYKKKKKVFFSLRSSHSYQKEV